MMDHHLAVLCRLLTLVAALMLPGMIVLSGCLPIMPPPPSVHDESLLTGEPCLPPCWYGIVPGQTTTEEAIEILRNLPFVASSALDRGEAGWPWFDERLSWMYVAGTHPTHGGQLYTRQGIIVWIRVSLPRKLKLVDVLTVQGEPDLVTVGVATEINWHEFGFFFAERGLLLGGHQTYPVPEGRERAQLLPDIPITEAEYFAPRDLTDYFVEVQGDTEETAKERALRWHPWPGFGKEVSVGP